MTRIRTCITTSMTSNNARKRQQQSRQFKLVGVWEVGLKLCCGTMSSPLSLVSWKCVEVRVSACG